MSDFSREYVSPTMRLMDYPRPQEDVLLQFDAGFAEAKRKGRPLDFLAEALRSEIAAREVLSRTINESFAHIDLNFSQIFRKLEEQNAKGASLEREVKELSALLRNYIQEVQVLHRKSKDDMDRAINEQVGHLSEQVGALLREISENKRQDNLQEESISKVQNLANLAKKDAEDAKAHYKKTLAQAALSFGGRVFALSFVVSVYELGNYFGWWAKLGSLLLHKLGYPSGMALNCSTQALLWGSGWGSGWGGPPFMPGGPLPAEPPFDLFCVCGAATQHINTYINVSVTPGDPAHNFAELDEGTYHLRSEDGVRSGLFVDQPLPPNHTLEVIFRLPKVPPDLGTKTRHIFVGLYDDALSCMGLFLSQGGVAYGASYDDAPLLIPNSSGLLVPGGIYALRIVVDEETDAAYVYLAELEQALKGNYPLKFTLPLLDTQYAPSHIEGVYLSVLGTEASPSELALDGLCLSSQSLIVNRPPIADPGPDQTVRGLVTLRLDGSKSRDPEGSPLVYLWRMVGAPEGSKYTSLGLDGRTLSDPSGYVDRLYTSHAGAGPDSFPFTLGDLIVFGEDKAFIVGVGTDGDGDYYELDGAYLSADKLDQPFHLVRQDGLTGRTDPVAFLRPDVEGLYRFELQVSDTIQPSPWVGVLANVLSREQAHGVLPEASWIWDYLGDSWRLLEDPERIESVWAGMLQILGGEAMRLWQAGRSRSLRDIPRQVQRRWLNYDLLLREPYPDLAQVTSRWTGVSSTPLSHGGLSVQGQRLVISVPGRESLVELLLPSNAKTPSRLAKLLNELLEDKEPRIVASVVPHNANQSRVLLNAPFPFVVVEAPVTTLLGFVGGGISGQIEGSVGEKVDTFVWKSDRSLLGLGIQEDDLLGVFRLNGQDTGVFRIAAVQDVPGDEHRGQRLLLKDPLPSDLFNLWAVLTKVTSPQLQFWQGGVSFFDPAITYIGSLGRRNRVVGVHPDLPFSLGLNLDQNILSELRPDRPLRFWGVYRTKLIPVSPLVTSVPRLQVNPWEQEEDRLLRENEDFRLVQERGGHFLRFRHNIFEGSEMTPPKFVVRLWAEETYLDNGPTIEANFGCLVGLTQERAKAASSDMDYLSAVRGLWFAFHRGPRIGNLRIASQILLGLPFAETEGTLLEVDTRYSKDRGRLLIQDADTPTNVRSYTYPNALDLEINPATKKPYAAGDKVVAFAPLVQGVVVEDWVNNPTWMRPFVSQGVMSELEKMHTFLVQIDLEAFSLTTLAFVDEFLKKVKPARTKPIFLVRKRDLSADTVDITDEMEMQGALELFASPYVQAFSTPLASQPNTDDHEGSAGMLDQPDPSPGIVPPSPLYSGHFKTAFDTDIDPATPILTSGFDDGISAWGLDLAVLSPHQVAYGTLILDYDGVEAMTIFQDIADDLNQALLQGDCLVFGRHWVPPFGENGIKLEGDAVPPSNFEITYLEARLSGTPPSGGRTYKLRIFKNDTLFIEVELFFNFPGENLYTFGPSPSQNPMPAGGPFLVTTDDEIKAGLYTTAPDRSDHPLKLASVVLGQGVEWDPLDAPIAAGTYFTLRTLLGYRRAEAKNYPDQSAPNRGQEQPEPHAL